MLGRRLERRVQGQFLAVDEYVAEDNGEKADYAPDSNGQEDQTRRLEVEMVHQSECVGNSGEETEEDAKVDCDVEAEEGDDGFGKEHVHGANDGNPSKEREFSAEGNLGR